MRAHISCNYEPTRTYTIIKQEQLITDQGPVAITGILVRLFPVFLWKKTKTKQECLSALCRASFVDVYLAYLKSYGHLKIVKCIGMY